MAFEGFLQKYQHTTFWLSLMLVHVLIITPSYSQEICVKSGDYMCHEEKPNLYYHCTGFKIGVIQSCAGGLNFDLSINGCNWPNPDDCRASIDQSKANPPTKPVVTTDGVSFKRSSLLSKVLSSTTSKPSTQITKKPELTGPCRPEHCKLPNCKCPGPEIPGSLSTNSTPQIILLTFDDGINEHNIDYYRDLFGSNITNSNGCPIQATFFVSGDYTKYEYVKELYNQGHEIASHSISHRFPPEFWLNADYKTYYDEIVGMKQLLIEKANIAEEDIRGMRSPFLALGKNNQFKMLENNGFYYDSSMVTGSLSTTTEMPTWPFTLDYPVTSTYCKLGNCPVKTYPGLWEVPLVRWYTDEKKACSMADSCTVSKNSVVAKLLEDNFNRHYKANKAPFGIFLHAPWLTNNLKALKNFLEEVSLKKDVWIVTVSQALQWIQNPVSFDINFQFKSWNCKLTK